MDGVQGFRHTRHWSAPAVQREIAESGYRQRERRESAERERVQGERVNRVCTTSVFRERLRRVQREDAESVCVCAERGA